MSFADELRDAPEQMRKEVEEQKRKAQLRHDQDWDRFINQCYTAIKDKCKSWARSSSTSCSFSLDEFIPQRSDDYYLDGSPVEKNGDSWEERIENRTWYRLKPKQSYRKCLSKEDITSLTETLKQHLEADGLTVDIAIVELQKYSYEQQFVKRSDSERKFNRVFNTLFDLDHDDEGAGEYKRVLVKDGFRYSFKMTVSWS